jgi:hypothetical protein
MHLFLLIVFLFIANNITMHFNSFRADFFWNIGSFLSFHIIKLL